MNAAALSGLVDRVGWTLVHSMSQGVVVAGGLAVVLRLLRGASARARYGVSCLALAALVAWPVGTFYVLGDRTPEQTTFAVGGIARTRPAAPVGDASATLFSELIDTSAELPHRWSPLAVVVGVWGAGVIVLGIWQAAGFVWLAWMVRRRTSDAAPEVLAVVARMRERLGVRRAVRVFRAGWVEVPSVVGVLRPVILVPMAVMNGLSPQQVESLIAHELAHVRRWDAIPPAAGRARS